MRRMSLLLADLMGMAGWSFLTNHGRAVLVLADRPDVRLTDLALELGVTGRTAFGIVSDLTAAGYVVKERVGRRNRYLLNEQLPLPETIGRSPTLGDFVGLFS